MKIPPHCPNPDCPLHYPEAVEKLRKENEPTFQKCGTRSTQAFGIVQRFLCTVCGKTCSEQTFSLDYYAKRVVDYEELERLNHASTGLRAAARHLCCSPDTVSNRNMRLSRQFIAANAEILEDHVIKENLAIDGFESKTLSNYHPNNINIAAGSDSQFVYGASYTQLNRKGHMTKEQKIRARELKNQEPQPFSKQQEAIQVLALQVDRLIPDPETKITVFSDEHLAYPDPIAGIHAQVTHKTISSKDPRTRMNPLFPVNYMDREFRKDLKEHGVKTVCIARNVNAQLERMHSYLFYHNYLKQFRINDPVSMKHYRHYHRAGIDEQAVKKATTKIYTRRKFFSHVRTKLTWFEQLVWMRLLKNPEVPTAMYLPRFLTCY
jgi:hypothetical protein